MVAELKDNPDKIVETCKQMKVKSLYLVGPGTKVTGFTSQSDPEFLCRMLSPEEVSSPGGLGFFDFLWKPEGLTGRKFRIMN